MVTQVVREPFSAFHGLDGKPLEGGHIYIGEPGFEARSMPKASFINEGLTISAGTQGGASVRTIAGFPAYGGAIVNLYIDGGYSITVTDKYGVTVYSAVSVFSGSTDAEGVRFTDTATMAASASLVNGSAVLVDSGYGGAPETFNIVPANTYAANGSTVIICAASNVQAVSNRRNFETHADLLADTRPDTFFASNPAVDAEGIRFSVVGGRGYSLALSIASDNAYVTVGGSKLYADAAAAPALGSMDNTSAGQGTARIPTTAAGTFPSGLAAADEGVIQTLRADTDDGVQVIHGQAVERSYLRRIIGGVLQSFREIVTVAAGAAKGALPVFNGTNWTGLAVGADGQVLVADAAEVTGVKWGGAALISTPVSTTGSGTIDLVTDLEPGINWFEIKLSKVISNSTTGDPVLQLIDDGVPVTSGYDCGYFIDGGGGTVGSSHTGGLALRTISTTNGYHGTIRGDREPGTQTWNLSYSILAISSAAQISDLGSGALVTLSTELTGLRLVRSSGAFNAGRAWVRSGF